MIAQIIGETTELISLFKADPARQRIRFIANRAKLIKKLNRWAAKEKITIKEKEDLVKQLNEADQD